MTIDGWSLIDAAEIQAGKTRGRARTTIHDRARLLDLGVAPEDRQQVRRQVPVIPSRSDLMNVDVDRDVCLRHGHCCVTAPEVFQLNEAGLLEFVQHPHEDLREAVEEAADGCPAQAITVED